MSKHFFQYWKPDTVDYNLKRDPILEHSGSDQLNRVNSNDIVWIVTVRNGELFVAGKILVGLCTDLEGAKQYLNTNDIWDAKYHIIAKPGTAEPLKVVSLKGLVSKLRFESKKSDRLKVVNGLINAQQLQSMRQLTLDSSKLVEAEWLKGQPRPETAKSSRTSSSSPETSIAVDIESPPSRVKTTTTRIIRDTAKAKRLKEKYDYQCQVCGERITISEAEFYAEVHHIRPLGGRHKGIDTENNMLVLCPNHHAMFDLRIPYFVSVTEIEIGSDRIKLKCKHSLTKNNIEYHNQLRSPRGK